MKKILLGIFSKEPAADEALLYLKAEGFSADELSVERRIKPDEVLVSVTVTDQTEHLARQIMTDHGVEELTVIPYTTKFAGTQTPEKAPPMAYQNQVRRSRKK